MRKSLTPLGETEMEVLNIVWEFEQATVKQVWDKILETRDLAYTTVMTTMKNLANKKYLKYTKTGNAYLYKPAISPDVVRFKLVNELVNKVFSGSAGELVQTLVQNENLTNVERKEILDLIQNLNDEQ